MGTLQSYQRCLSVVDSCKTIDHINTAQKYCEHALSVEFIKPTEYTHFINKLINYKNDVLTVSL